MRNRKINAYKHKVLLIIIWCVTKQIININLKFELLKEKLQTNKFTHSSIKIQHCLFTLYFYMQFIKIKSVLYKSSI